MNKDQAEKLSKDALDELAATLESGRSERLTGYLAAMARFHNYSFGNVLLIVRQCPNAGRVAGFGAWKRLNRWVKKGEKGIGIIAPLVRRGEAGAEDENSIRGFRVVHVFDLAQTEGEPLPELAAIAGDPGESTQRLRQLIASKGIELRYVEDLGGALGCSKGGAIEIVSNLSSAQEFEVLVHELAHESLHRRDTSDRIPPRDVRELEAEAVAYAVCQGIGLSARDSSTDYIGLYQGSKELLLASLERIQRTAAEILSAVLHPSTLPDAEQAAA